MEKGVLCSILDVDLYTGYVPEGMRARLVPHLDTSVDCVKYLSIHTTPLQEIAAKSHHLHNSFVGSQRATAPSIHNSNRLDINSHIPESPGMSDRLGISLVHSPHEHRYLAC